MESKFAKYEQYLLTELNTKATISDAYLLKVGFIKLQFNNDFTSIFFTDEKKDLQPIFKTYVENLYTAISSSPHIMEVTPLQETLLAEKNKRLFYQFWATENIDFISLSQYIKLRVVLPKKKRDELSKPFLAKVWNPE